MHAGEACCRFACAPDEWDARLNGNKLLIICTRGPSSVHRDWKHARFRGVNSIIRNDRYLHPRLYCRGRAAIELFGINLYGVVPTQFLSGPCKGSEMSLRRAALGAGTATGNERIFYKRSVTMERLLPPCNTYTRWQLTRRIISAVHSKIIIIITIYRFLFSPRITCSSRTHETRCRVRVRSSSLYCSSF